jgi:hypothetical protein
MSSHTALTRGPRAALVLTTAVLTLTAAPAFAQLSRVGDTVLTLGGSGARTTADTAYDPNNDVYLVVTGSGPVYGVFVNAWNQAVTGSFTIFDGDSGFGHFPRARYSSDVSNGAGGSGGFLVTWTNGINIGLNSIRGRIVAYAGGAPRIVSEVQNISDLSVGSAFMENRATIAYSRTSGLFLVAWTTESFAIQGRLLSVSGTPLGSVLTFEPGASRDPALTWNPATNEFGMANSGFSGGAYAQFRRIRPSDGAAFGRSTFGYSGTGTFATGIDVNSDNQYVMTWGVGPGTYSAMFDANGTQQTSATYVASTLGGDLSMGLAYNPASNSFLAVSSSWESYDIGGVGLASNGAATTSQTIVTSGASPSGASYYPLVTSRTNTNQWNVVHSRGFLDAWNQIVSTSASAPAPSPTPTPTAPSGSCTTSDPFAGLGGGTCCNGGWLPPGMACAGTATVTSAPAPAPTSSGTCSSADPFASMGGGTCCNGGWLPPGMACQGSVSTTSTPLPSSSTCSGSDPFASIGGGVCVNGGWVPASSGCTGSDPFVSIGGGVCINGGWVPKG